MEREHVIAIDVGGRVFKVLRPTVMKYPESTLAQVLAGKDLQNLVIVDHTYFFDRNPDYFAVVLDFMRNGKLFLPPQLTPEQMRIEAQYWRMPGICKELQEPAAQKPVIYKDSPMMQAATPPFDAVPGPQIVPTLLLDPQGPDQRYAQTLLVQQYDATMLVDERKEADQSFPTTLLLDDQNQQKKPFAATLLLEEPVKGQSPVNKYAATLLLNEAPEATMLIPDDHDAPVYPTTLLLDDPHTTPPPPRNRKPDPIQPTLMLQDPVDPGTPELSTPKLSDSEEFKSEQKNPSPKIQPKETKPVKADDDLLGSLMEVQDPAPKRALPFGGAAGNNKPKKAKPEGKYKRKRDSSSEGSNLVEEDYESSFIDDNESDDALEAEYKPKKKTKRGGKKPTPAKKVAARPRRGSEEIPLKRPPQVLLLSGFGDKERKEVEAAILQLGGKVAESFEDAPTALVMPEFKRNIKLLVAVNQGVLLVKATWVDESVRMKKWTDPTAHRLCTPAIEAMHNFRYQETAIRAKQRGDIHIGFLTGFSVWISPSADPAPHEFRSVVTSAGGVILPKRPMKLSNSTLVIAGDESKAKDFLPLTRLGYKIHTIELLCQGALSQELDLNKNIFPVE